jgi:hypothetical protein
MQQIMNRLNELYVNLARVTKVTYNQTAAQYMFELQTFEGCEFFMIYAKSPASYTLVAGPLFNTAMDPDGDMPACMWSPVREDEVLDVNIAAVESIPVAAQPQEQSGGRRRSRRSRHRKTRRSLRSRGRGKKSRRVSRRAITRRR